MEAELPVDGSPMPGFPGVGLGAVEFFYDREVCGCNRYDYF